MIRLASRMHLAAVVIAAAVVIGGCGGDDDGNADSAASKGVSGRVSIIAVWSGDEQESFQAVLDGFTSRFPDVTVKYTSGGDTCRRSSRPRCRAADRPTSPASRSRGS